MSDNRPNGKLWLSFGEDAVIAANSLIAQHGLKMDEISVHSNLEASVDKSFCLSNLWPFFTNNPR